MIEKVGSLVEPFMMYVFVTIGPFKYPLAKTLARIDFEDDTVIGDA